MLIRHFLLPSALLAALALASCEKEDNSPTDTTLLANRWMLARIDDFPIDRPDYAAASGSYLEFVDLGECTVGLGPCNNFSSRFSLRRNTQQLRIAAPIPTRAPCPAQALETRYLTNLAQTARYEISGGELRLYDATTTAPRLVFRRAQP